MEYFIYSIVFVLGTIIGSFLNLVVDRATFNKSILFPASHCPHCRRKLGIFDLIPLVSYVYLSGQCRYCHTHLSYYYPAVEVFTGGIFVIFAYFLFGSLSPLYLTDIRIIILMVFYMYIVSAMVVIFFTDLKYGLIPFKVVFSSVLVTLGLYLMLPLFHFKAGELFFLNTGNNYFFNYLLSAVSVMALFLGLFFITRGRGMGFGDVVYVFLMGLVLGFPSLIVGLYVAFLTGAFVSLILVLVGKKKMPGGTIPFGPFLILGTVVGMIWGTTIIDMIMKYLLR